MKLLWRHKLSVVQGRKAVSPKDTAAKETIKKDPPKEKARSSPLKQGPILEKSILDPLEDPKVQVCPPSIASGPVVEKNLPLESIAQSSPAVEEVPLLGATELIRLEQETSAQSFGGHHWYRGRFFYPYRY